MGSFLLSHIGWGDATLMKLATRNPVTPGGEGFTYQRFEEIKRVVSVDMLFLGSSHCYRTFDPRIYAEHGLKVFNMGTSGQTPLNTYYLLKQYFDQLKPRLVVFELYYDLYRRDGLESYFDLSVNLPFSGALFQMALATRNPHGVNDAVSRWLAQATDGTRQVAQAPQPGERYIEGGFIEYTDLRLKGYEANPSRRKKTIAMVEAQFEYLEKIAAFVLSRNTRIVFVTQPELPETLAAVTNYGDIVARFQDIAGRHGIQYFNFNDMPPRLDAAEYYYDREHLNKRGVEAFNRAVVQVLAEEGYLYND
jgi:hypothetical protein